MTDNEILESFRVYNAFWEFMPKNEILYREEPSTFWLLFKVKHRRVLMYYFLGPRGGIKEVIIVLHPKAASQLDQLQHFHLTDTRDDSHWGLQPKISKSVREGLSFEESTRDCLESLLADLQKGEYPFAIELMNAIPGHNESIPTIAGGLPSLGR